MRSRALALLLSLLGLGEGVNEKNREGAELYERGDLAGAVAAFTRAQVESPDAKEIHYNIGNVRYRKEEREEAFSEFRAALSASGETSRRAHYNIGNLHFRAEDYPSAVEAYKEALKIDPDDVEARQNLELALRQHERQQQNAGGGGGGGGGGGANDPSEGQASESSVSREQAERILAALAEMERAERGLDERQGGRAEKKGKDW